MRINDGSWGMLRVREVNLGGAWERMEVMWGMEGRMGSTRDRRGTEDVHMVECEYVNQVEFEWQHSEREMEWLEVNEGQTGIR